MRTVALPSAIGTSGNGKWFMLYSPLHATAVSNTRAAGRRPIKTFRDPGPSTPVVGLGWVGDQIGPGWSDILQGVAGLGLLAAAGVKALSTPVEESIPRSLGRGSTGGTIPTNL